MDHFEDPSKVGPPQAFDKAKAATIAPLGKKEKDPAAGERRRRNVAVMLGVAGGIGTAVVMKSSATAVALWLGAPALGVVAVGAVAAMAASGSVGYFAKRAALKRAGQPVPKFSFGALFKNMFASKPALMAGGMTALAAVIPAAGMLALGSAVAAVSAGAHEYSSKRKERKAAGEDVGPFSFREMFSTVTHSRSAKKAFLISAVVGGVFSAFSGVSFAPTTDSAAADLNTVADVPPPPPQAQDYVGRYEIQRGDTLWGISHDVLGDQATNSQIAQKVQEIAVPNSIQNPDFIRAGDTLSLQLPNVDMAELARLQDSLPGISAEPVDSSIPAVAAPVVRQDYVGQYEVQRGDTLWAISKDMLGAQATNAQIAQRVHEIAALNGLQNADFIRAGDTLNLPLADADTAELARIQDSLPGMTAEPAPNLDAQLAEGKSDLQAAHEKAAAAKAEAPVQQAPVHHAPAAPVSAPVAAAPDVTPPVVVSCQFIETVTKIFSECDKDIRKMGDVLMPPGSSIEFYVAAQPETLPVVWASTAPVSVRDFYANHALPEAEEAYNNGNGRFIPKP